SRPYSHYHSQASKSTTGGSQSTSLSGADLPDWVLMHFQADDASWQSPQLITQPPAKPGQKTVTRPTPQRVRRPRQVLAELTNYWSPSELLALIPEDRPALVLADNNAAPAQANTTNVLNQNAASQTFNEYDKRLQYQNRVKQEAYQPAFRDQ